MLRSLKFQIYALTLLPLLIAGILSAVGLLSAINLVQTNTTKTISTSVLEVEKKGLISVMNSVETIIQPYAKLPNKEGYAEGMKILNSIRFNDGQGYIFTITSDGTMLQHGINHGNVGKNFINTTDAKGARYFEELIKSAKDQSHFVKYYHLMPGDKDPSEKFAYAIYIPEWDAVISSGIYLDETKKNCGFYCD